MDYIIDPGEKQIHFKAVATVLQSSVFYPGLYTPLIGQTLKVPRSLLFWSKEKKMAGGSPHYRLPEQEERRFSVDILNT